MALFMAYCHDAPGASEPRQKYLKDHLRYVEQVIDRVKLGGPLIGGDGLYCGSLLVIEAADLEDARALLDSDPYVAAGVWERIEILPYKPVCGTLIGGITWPPLSGDQQD